MATTTQKLTAREFVSLPRVQAGAWLELVKGEMVAMARPNLRHAYVIPVLTMMLTDYVEKQNLGLFYLQLHTIFDHDEVRAPDLLFLYENRTPDPDAPLDLIPDLCIEILSPFNA